MTKYAKIVFAYYSMLYSQSTVGIINYILDHIVYYNTKINTSRPAMRVAAIYSISVAWSEKCCIVSFYEFHSRMVPGVHRAKGALQSAAYK